MRCSEVHHGCLAKRISPYWLLLFWLTMPTAVPAQSLLASIDRAPVTLPTRLAALDSANGFHQFTFDTRLSDWSQPLVNLRTTKNGQVTAEVPAERVLIGNILMQGLHCHFYNGRLARLDFALTSEADAEELLRVLQARYGTGQPAGANQVVWTGQVVTLVYTLVVITYGHGRQVDITRKGQVSLLSNALLAEQQAEQAASRREPRDK